MNYDPYNGPHLTYHGDQTDALYNRVLGPDEHGQYTVVVDTSYDVLLNITDAYVRPLRREEIKLVAAEGGQHYLTVDR